MSQIKKLKQIAQAHGWRELHDRGKNDFVHDEFTPKKYSLRIAGDVEGWLLKKNKQVVAKGETPGSLLKHLTKFHQQTLPLAPAIERQLKGQRELAEFRATGKQPKQPKQEHDIKNLTPRVEHGFFLQGPVKFAVDADDIFRTLSCGAFGIGQVRAREGILVNLGETELKRWAEVNGLPTKPYAKELLIEALRGVLQNAFYFAERDGLVPEHCIVNQARRMKEFKEKFEAFAKTATVKAERLQASLKAPALRSQQRWPPSSPPNRNQNWWWATTFRSGRRKGGLHHDSRFC